MNKIFGKGGESFILEMFGDYELGGSRQYKLDSDCGLSILSSSLLKGHWGETSSS